MPELPELETITTQLAKVLVGKKITSVKVLRKTSFVGNSQLLVNKTINTISRRAKMGVFEFTNWDHLLIVHLKMTGQLVFVGKTRIAGGHPTADFVNKLPSSHTRVIISFNNKSHLYFNDLRAFGWLKIISKKGWHQQTNQLPPDVIDPSFTLKYFIKIIGKSRRPIKVVIMDQTKLGGVGNIYANDALLLAKVNPILPANKLKAPQAKALHQAITKVIKKGIKYGGASYSNYIDASGKGGKYQEHFVAYGKDGSLCTLCKSAKIKKTQLAGRGTYHCPVCQK